MSISHVRLKSAAIALHVAFAGAALAEPAADAEPGIATAVPEAVGVDSAPLVRMSEWIRKDKLDVRSLLIVKDGKLIFERYGQGLTRDHNYELYSITKNVTALAAGVLIDEGRARLDEKVAPVLTKARPDLKDAFADKQAIELRHVMSMSTGLFYNFKPTDDPIYYGAPDRLKLAAETTPKRQPGEAFEYTDVNPILASATLAADAGMPLEKFAEQKLFKPMGMTHYAWERADDGAVIVRTQACETICRSSQRPPERTSMPSLAMSTARSRRPQPADTSPLPSARSQA